MATPAEMAPLMNVSEIAAPTRHVDAHTKLKRAHFIPSDIEAPQNDELVQDQPRHQALVCAQQKQPWGVGMGEIVGETFEDLGNTIEYSISEVRAYERLSGDRVRLYVTEERGPAHVLLYTVVAPLSAFKDFGQKCFDIAGQKYALPDWAFKPRGVLPAH